MKTLKPAGGAKARRTVNKSVALTLCQFVHMHCEISRQFLDFVFFFFAHLCRWSVNEPVSHKPNKAAGPSAETGRLYIWVVAVVGLVTTERSFQLFLSKGEASILGISLFFPSNLRVCFEEKGNCCSLLRASRNPVWKSPQSPCLTVFTGSAWLRLP